MLAYFLPPVKRQYVRPGLSDEIRGGPALGALVSWWFNPLLPPRHQDTKKALGGRQSRAVVPFLIAVVLSSTLGSYLDLPRNPMRACPQCQRTRSHTPAKTSHTAPGSLQLAGWRGAQLCGLETGLKSGEPITLKKLDAAMGAARQGLQSSVVCYPLR